MVLSNTDFSLELHIFGALRHIRTPQFTVNRKRGLKVILLFSDAFILTFLVLPQNSRVHINIDLPLSQVLFTSKAVFFFFLLSSASEVKKILIVDAFIGKQLILLLHQVRFTEDKILNHSCLANFLLAAFL